MNNHSASESNIQPKQRISPTEKAVDFVFAQEKGVILVLALSMLVVLSLMAAVVMNMAGANLQVVAYEKMWARSFYSAESGITQARNDMQAYLAVSQSGQWPASDQTVVTGVMGVDVEKQYSITLSGNTVDFGYSIADFGVNNDSTVLVTSTGTFKGVQQRVETIIRYEPPNSIGSQECYNANCQGVDQSSANKVTNNLNSTSTL